MTEEATVQNPSIQHAMTIDVEDYFQVSAFEKTLPREQWQEMPSRVEGNTRKLLEFYEQRNLRATFFVLGCVAAQFPHLVREIAAKGHEIACHGYSHRLIYEQERATFEQETKDSKALLEDLSGTAVLGYRAASYSITNRSLWALDTLAECGFEYDSSIFPIHHDRYGIVDAPREIHIAKSPAGAEIIEFPLSTATFGRLRIPIAGGGYFRLYPFALTRALWRRAISETNQPQVFYLHPWEIDPDQPRMPGISLTTRFRHYLNLARCESRLSALSDEFNFGTMADIIAQYRQQQLTVHSYSA